MDDHGKEIQNLATRLNGANIVPPFIGKKLNFFEVVHFNMATSMGMRIMIIFKVGERAILGLL